MCCYTGSTLFFFKDVHNNNSFTVQCNYKGDELLSGFFQKGVFHVRRLGFSRIPKTSGVTTT